MSENIQDIKTQTRLRRVEFFYPSEIEILGDFYQYGGKKLESLKIFIFLISIKEKSIEKIA